MEKKECKHKWKKFSEAFYRIFSAPKGKEMPTHGCTKCGVMVIIKEEFANSVKDGEEK